MTFTTRARTWERWGIPLALFPALVALLLVVNRPWAQHFASGLVHHWDPPFHAWKLMVGARAILDGHVLPPGGNSNCFFPSSLTYFYEALHWPQSLFAAGALLFTDNPILVYHLTLLVFWAFSGLCFYWLLRELRLCPSAASLGAAIFCVIPYRRFYFPEFNMQLCVGLVLSILFGLRCFTRRGFRSGLAFGLAFWLQASSELYQALIFVMVAPFLFASFLVEKTLWRDRRFWRAVAGAACTVPLTVWFLRGYSTLHGTEGMIRDLGEITKHLLEPLAYLVAPGTHAILNHQVLIDETSFNPTWPVLLLALAYGWMHRWPRSDARTATGKPPRGLMRLRLGAVAVCVAVVVFVEFVGVGGKATAAIFNLAFLLLLATVVALQLLAPHRDASRGLVAGLGTAACVAFLLSLGPTVVIRAAGHQYPNWFFLWCYRIFPFLSGMRVISRFGFIVDIFAVVAAMAAWDGAIGRWRRMAWAGPAILGLVIAAYPPGVTKCFDPIDWQSRSQVVAAARASGRPVLFIPFGERTIDSPHMLAIGRHDLPMLYGWGGFYPWYQNKLYMAFKARRADRLTEFVAEAWPDARLLVDKRVVDLALAKRPQAPLVSLPIPGTVTLVEDDEYALLAVTPPPNPVIRRVRQTRRDLLDANPCLRLTARGTVEGQRLGLLVNGTWAAEMALSATNRTYVFEIPPALRLQVHPTRVEAASVDGSPWHAGTIEFSPRGAEPGDVAVSPASGPPSPWPAWFDQGPGLPRDAVPFTLRFKGGLTLSAIRPPTAPTAPGDSAVFQLLWTCAPNARIPRGANLFLHAKEGSGTPFQCDAALLPDTPTGDFRCQPYRKVFTQNIALRIPPGTRPGSYPLDFGLYLRGGTRLHGRSSLPSRHHAFRLPVALMVAAPGETPTLASRAEDDPARPVPGLDEAER